MDNRRTILICDNDYAFLNEMERGLSKEGFDVDTIDNASDLIPSAIRLQPHVILVNPDLTGFNEHDVCKNIIQEQRAQVILLVDKHSSTRAMVGDCMIEDVLTKPVKLADLVYLVMKHLSVDQ
ncbi:MAG TPA: response regulator [Flavisolibacter sp.]|nr:response regulator [Flavisolibacter sp.]